MNFKAKYAHLMAFNKVDFDTTYGRLLAKAYEAEGDEGPIDITDEGAESQSFGDTDADGDVDEEVGTDEGGDDIAAGAEDETNQMEGDMDEDMGDEDMDTPGEDDMSDSGMDANDPGTTDPAGNDITTDPQKIAETKQLLVHLYNNIKSTTETISSITLLYPISSEKIEEVKNDLIKLNSIIFKIVTSKKDTKSYPELLKKYYSCKELYGVKLEILIQIIKSEISEKRLQESSKNKKDKKKKSKATK